MDRKNGWVDRWMGGWRDVGKRKWMGERME